MYTIDLAGKNAVVLNVANHRSIAWAVAQILHDAGANLAIGYVNERMRENVVKLAEPWGDAKLIECDVSSDEKVEAAFKQISDTFDSVDIIVHSIAFANRDDLGGRFIDTGREGYRIALDISAYSLVSIARHGAPLMRNGGSIITMTYQASDRVFPGYNVMSTAKAALENEVKQLAYDLGPDNIRVNALSPGPVDTLSARGIRGFTDMKRLQVERSPMKRGITVEEVGKAALFLCSDMSSGITGEIIHVDTGYNIMGM
jgi:enoyl-[acyl-carrier protein] reductase I